MAPLSQTDVNQLLEEMRLLLVERERVSAIVADLPSTMGSLREALNELHRMLRVA